MIALFEEKHVRRAWNQAEEKWYFSIDDVVAVLTGTTNVKDYIKKLRKRDVALEAYWGTNCPLVAMPGADGKIRPIRAANAEALLRLIQSIPSPKAEPFKLWLAKVGYERLEETENPGILLPGLTIEDMKQGVSRIRNPVIARVFRELNLIEQWGSGVRRIFEMAQEQKLPVPEIIEIGMHVRFIVRLPTPILTPSRITDEVKGLESGPSQGSSRIASSLPFRTLLCLRRKSRS